MRIPRILAIAKAADNSDQIAAIRNHFLCTRLEKAFVAAVSNYSISPGNFFPTKNVVLC
jgi:hypothetical protein